MSTGASSKSLRLGTYGLRLFRPAAVLPATGNQNIFTVTGGNIILTTLIGTVTTTMSATVTNLKATAVATTGGAVNDLCANVAVTSLGVSSLFGISGSSGTAAQIGAAVQQSNEYIINPGIIRITTDATNTGAMSWTLMYVPLDDGASVAVV